MVAVVAGNSLGLTLTSLATLAEQGTAGSAGTGRSGEQVYVNASNGNLVVQDRDEKLASRGVDLVALRTYNSEGKIVGGHADAWALGSMRERIVPPASWGSGLLV
ncbi:MAG TPA: hypothetical protein VHA82_02605, partial [Ramlibacter sp.]|uniref:hypothetical protein n=1 Tax=Ramlibacter sp. TaxID=1917967 RepID=UPI002BF17CF7